VIVLTDEAHRSQYDTPARISPAEYLQAVFERLPKATTSELKSLTPSAWAKARHAAQQAAA
jgi:type I site-specific restriction-modification system R (restriction) subunit